MCSGRHSKYLGERFGREAGDERGFCLVRAEDVDERPQLVGQRRGRRRRGVEDGGEAGRARVPQRREGRGERHLELREQHAARGERAAGGGGVDIGRAEQPVRAGHDDDDVLAAGLLDRDLRDARRCAARRRDVARVDAERAEVLATQTTGTVTLRCSSGRQSS